MLYVDGVLFHTRENDPEVEESIGEFFGRLQENIDDDYSTPWMLKTWVDNKGLNVTDTGQRLSDVVEALGYTSSAPFIGAYYYYIAGRVFIIYDGPDSGGYDAEEKLRIMTPNEFIDEMGDFWERVLRDYTGTY